jgi:hypothetical protein
MFRVEDMENPEQIVQCMQSHASELDPLCRDFVQNATVMIKALHDGCDADMAALCPNTPDFSPERKTCVVHHLADLSKPCLSAISTLLVEREKLHPPGGPHGPHGPWGPGGGGPWGPGGGGPWGPDHDGRGHHFAGALMGALFFGGFMVIVLGVCFRCLRRMVCGPKCRRGPCCRHPHDPQQQHHNQQQQEQQQYLLPQQQFSAPPPPQHFAVPQQQQQYSAPPQWQAFHVAQPVTPAEAFEAGAAAAQRTPLPGGGALYPAGAGGAEGYNRF